MPLTFACKRLCANVTLPWWSLEADVLRFSPSTFSKCVSVLQILSLCLFKYLCWLALWWCAFLHVIATIMSVSRFSFVLCFPQERGGNGSHDKYEERNVLLHERSLEQSGLPATWELMFDEADFVSWHTLIKCLWLNKKRPMSKACTYKYVYIQYK